MCPVSPMGRLFTCFYVLLGIFTLMAAVAPFIDWVLAHRKHLEEWIEQIVRKAGKGENDGGQISEQMAALADADGDGVLDEEEAKLLQVTSGSFAPMYLRAISGPMLVFVIGLSLGLGFVTDGDGNRLTLIDATYFTIITMTTIGYGDVNFIDHKWVGMFFLPLAVTALADAVGEIAKISVCKKIQQTDYTAKVDQLLLEEAKGNPHETLTEAEFLISVLKSEALVDDATLLAIRLQFAKITRHNTYAQGEAALLDAKAVFAELVSQGRIGHSGGSAESQDGLRRISRAASRMVMRPQPSAEPSTAAAKPVVVANADLVNLEASDAGYQEWYRKYWLPRVVGDTKSITSPPGTEKKFGLRMPAFKLLKLSKGGMGMI